MVRMRVRSRENLIMEEARDFLEVFVALGAPPLPPWFLEETFWYVTLCILLSLNATLD